MIIRWMELICQSYLERYLSNSNRLNWETKKRIISWDLLLRWKKNRCSYFNSLSNMQLETTKDERWICFDIHFQISSISKNNNDHYDSHMYTIRICRRVNLLFFLRHHHHNQTRAQTYVYVTYISLLIVLSKCWHDDDHHSIANSLKKKTREREWKNDVCLFIHWWSTFCPFGIDHHHE